MKNIMFTNIVIAFVIALGIACAGYFISHTLVKSKVAVNVAEVKGLAERQVRADIAVWRIDFQVTGSGATNIKTLYQRSQRDQQKLINYFQNSGFEQSEITIGVVDYSTHEYRNAAQEVVEQRQTLRGSIEINSRDVDRVAYVRSGVNELIAEGINLTNHRPRFLFTELNSIKPEMLREATENARVAANEFAQVANVNVAGIRSATQGRFAIRDRGQAYGDDAKIEKTIRVVTTIVFYMD